MNIKSDSESGVSSQEETAQQIRWLPTPDEKVPFTNLKQ